MKGELVNRYEGWKMGEEAGGSTQRETHIGASIYRIGEWGKRAKRKLVS